MGISDLFKENSVVQRLATGTLTEDDKRGYSEENEKFRDGAPPPEPTKVSFKLKKEEKIAMFQDIKSRVIDGSTPEEIGRAVIACMEEVLEEKEAEAYGKAGRKIGLIRRVE